MFSVLMSVYYKENPSFLSLALDSIFRQTLPVSEFILVLDGPLTDPLYRVIDEYKKKLPLVIVPLPSNLGLARALNIGLKVATQEWIMRFDSDDYCLPDRVAIQSKIALTDQYDIFSSSVAEFDCDHLNPISVRPLPSSQSGISRYALIRCPFNHMATCYRREYVLDNGGYPSGIPFMEDYALWINMLAKGARVFNIDTILVHARVGNGMLQRRGGLHYVKSEFKLQKLMVQLGFKNILSAYFLASFRSFIFLLPISVKSFIYNHLLRDKFSHVIN